jgi:hypothetical protein
MVERKQRLLYTLRKINQLLKGKERRGGLVIGSHLPIQECNVNILEEQVVRIHFVPAA